MISPVLKIRRCVGVPTVALPEHLQKRLITFVLFPAFGGVQVFPIVALPGVSSWPSPVPEWISLPGT